MGYTSIVMRRDGQTCIVTLNRPEPRNAISLRMMDEIIADARNAEAD